MEVKAQPRHWENTEREDGSLPGRWGKRSCERPWTCSGRNPEGCVGHGGPAGPPRVPRCGLATHGALLLASGTPCSPSRAGSAPARTEGSVSILSFRPLLPIPHGTTAGLGVPEARLGPWILAGCPAAG